MSPRRSLLFILPSLNAGGAQRVVVNLLQQIDRSLFKPSILVCSLKDEVFRSEIPEDIELIDMAAPSVRSALSRVVREIWRRRPDIVFSTMEHMIFALACARPFWPPGVKFVLRPTIMLEADVGGRPDRRLRMGLARWCVGMADAVVFQSKDMEQHWREALAWKGGRACVIPNPLDLERIGKSLASSRDLRLPNKLNLVASGRLAPQKGFDVALEALTDPRCVDVGLTILGEGALRDALQNYIIQSGLQDRARLMGYVADPYPFYAEADAVLISSRYEGFPNVALEALACGAPVIATPVPGLQDLLAATPECALTADMTAPALADAISTFLKNGRRRVDPKIVESFGAPAITRRYEALFTSL